MDNHRQPWMTELQTMDKITDTMDITNNIIIVNHSYTWITTVIPCMYIHIPVQHPYTAYYATETTYQFVPATNTQ